MRSLLLLGAVATLSACGGMRTTGIPPNGSPGEITKYPYACVTSCLPISTRVVFDAKSVCKTEFLIKEIRALKGQDVVWKIDAGPVGTFRFKEVRDASGRLTRPGIAIDELDKYPEFENPRYGSSQAEYVWTATPRTTGHRHPYALYVELQSVAGGTWTECGSADPVIESN